MQMGHFNQRCLGVLQLRSETFREISEDPAAFRQSAAIVAVVGVIGLAASYVGDQDTFGMRVFDRLVGDDASSTVRVLVGGALSIAIVLATWLIEAGVTRFVGSRLGRPIRSLTLRSVAAPIGFTRLIDVLNVLYGVAFLGPIASVFSFIWGVAAGVTIVKLLFGVGTGRALVIYMASFLVFGVSAAGLFLATR